MPDYVNWLRHASPYINAHRDCTFVVMLPGDGVAHPNFGNIVHDLVLLHSLGVRLVLVHGSRPQIESRLQARGLTPRQSPSRNPIEAWLPSQNGLFDDAPQRQSAVPSLVANSRPC